MNKIKLAYLVTHPIQYQAPLLAMIAADPQIELTVFFCSDLSVRSYKDEGFGRMIEWDVPLLEGYRHEFLPALGRTDRLGFWRPVNHGLVRRLRRGGFDVLWVHGYARWINWVAIVAAKVLGIKVLLRDEATAIGNPRGALKARAKRWFFAGLRRLTDGFLAIGSFNRRYWLEHGVDTERIFLVPYCVDNARFRAQAAAAESEVEDLRRRLDLDPRRRVILFASKLIERKRAIDLVEAHAALSRTGAETPYLLIVGDGPERPALERRVAELGTGETAKFLGFRNQLELPAFFALSDVFVLPSVHEPWGLVVNEVMNAGRAVVVSDEVGCGPDLVQDGVNGAVFRARDVAGLAAALGRVLGDPERTKRMGENSRTRIERWGYAEDLAGLRAAIGYVLRGESAADAGDRPAAGQRSSLS